MHEQTHTSRRPVRVSPRWQELQGRCGDVLLYRRPIAAAPAAIFAVRVAVPSPDPSPRRRCRPQPPEPERPPPPAAPTAFSCQADAFAATRGLHRGDAARVSTAIATAAACSLPSSCCRRLLGPAVQRASGKSTLLDLRRCASLDRGQLPGTLATSAPVGSLERTTCTIADKPSSCTSRQENQIRTHQI